MPAPLSRRIAAARTYAGMSRLQLAERLGVSEETVARYERGNTTPTGTPMLIGIAHATGVPVWFVLNDFYEETPAQRFADAAAGAARDGGGEGDETTDGS